MSRTAFLPARSWRLGFAVVGMCMAMVACERPDPTATPSPSASVRKAPAEPSAPVSVSTPPPPVKRYVPPSGLPSLAPLVKDARPSVVTIKAWRHKDNAFGRRVLDAQGVGTGFVYDPSGLLLTNYHVIDDASEIVVRFVDGKQVEAKVIGADKPTDLAVIKVEQEGLKALELGDSKRIEVGDWVVAIGNPFGLEHTVSAGILSAKGRTRDDVKGLDPSGYFNFLQTDASINPGNSGGPLLNLAGQVVGINSAVRANANNIGFAIPMEMVLKLLPMLIKDGQIKRSAIGIWVDEVTSKPDEVGAVMSARGAKVTRVVSGGAAERAGVAAGDVVVAFDGKPIRDPNELRWLASIAGVGKTVALTLRRGERKFELNVTLDALMEQ